MKQPKLSPSAFPQLAQCPWFLSKPGTNAAAERGKAIHSMAYTILRGIPRDAFKAAGGYFAEEKAWFEAAFAAGAILGAMHGKDYSLEEKVFLRDGNDQYVTMGFIDAVARDGTILLDIKTGREGDFKGQMAVYALALMTDKQTDRVKVFEVYTKNEKVKVYVITYQEAADYVFPLVETVRSGTAKAVACGACRFCDNYVDCSEYNKGGV